MAAWLEWTHYNRVIKILCIWPLTAPVDISIADRDQPWDQGFHTMCLMIASQSVTCFHRLNIVSVHVSNIWSIISAISTTHAHICTQTNTRPHKILCPTRDRIWMSIYESDMNMLSFIHWYQFCDRFAIMKDLGLNLGLSFNIILHSLMTQCGSPKWNKVAQGSTNLNCSVFSQYWPFYRFLGQVFAMFHIYRKIRLSPKFR